MHVIDFTARITEQKYDPIKQKPKNYIDGELQKQANPEGHIKKKL